MINAKECLIIGGGVSIKPCISLLQPICANKFVIGCNYAFQTFNCTFTAFQDRDWYHGRPNDKGIYENPDIYSELKELPLIIGINHNGVDEFKLNNTLLLNESEKENLTGVFALKLALRLMETGTVYRTNLPERDPNYNPKSNTPTHYYNNINHRGIGYVGYYENHRPEEYFNKLIKKDVKVYNVCPSSNIECFEKISYEKMFSMLSTDQINQDELRNQIKEKICIA
jgi:hypothetical protein